MDSPHLLHWGLLLLALAAPRPSIAMCSAGPAKGTQDSFSGNTNVTVYLCKDNKICTCKSGENDLTNYTKIAETQNKAFSDVITELVDNKTHITVCFEQPNSCLEGIYGIFWEKAEGKGISCEILDVGENGRGNISTEEKNICCEAETNVWKHNSVLKCYTRKSCPKATLLDGISSERSIGNPEFLSRKMNNIGILFTFLFVGVCTGCFTMYYFLRLRRHQGFNHDRLLTKENTHI